MRHDDHDHARIEHEVQHGGAGLQSLGQALHSSRNLVSDSELRRLQYNRMLLIDDQIIQLLRCLEFMPAEILAIEAR